MKTTLLNRSPIWFNCFIYFGILLLIALWVPELSEDPLLGRIKYTIFACILMVIPAVLTYLFRTIGPRIAYTSNVLWLFSFILFLFHAYLTIFVYFDGIRESIDGQGDVIGILNIVLTVWWILNIILMYTVGLMNRGIRFQHALLMLAIVVAFLFTVLRRTGSVFLFGILVSIVLIAGIIIYFIVLRKSTPAIIPRLS